MEPEFLMESNSVTNFKEDLQRNIPAKFGPIWPSGLGGENVYEIVDDGRNQIL